MLEATGPNTGTFRVRSTGFSGNGKVSIVATYKQATFLDYVYFTQLETSDPVTYGFAEPVGGSDRRILAVHQVPARRPRERADPRHQHQFCDQIVFVGGDQIDGPLHTNDDLRVCGTPDVRSQRRPT